MCVNALIIAALLAAGQSRPTLVFVPEEETEEACFVSERAAAVIALTPSLRLVRGPRRPGEPLEAMRARVGTAVALSGTRVKMPAGTDELTLSIARENRSLDTRKEEGAGPERLELLLRAAWPGDLPPLADLGAPGAANAAAVEAACRGNAAEAYAASGAAIGRILRSKVPPPPGLEAKTLGHRFARATALARTNRCKEAAPILRGVVTALGRGEALPIWRRAPREGAPPSSISAFRDLFVTFENGRFVALDARSGSERWSLEAGKAMPDLADAGDGLAIATLESEVLAIDVDTGRVRWRAPLKAPSPEIATTSGRIFVAGEDEILALDRVKGDVVWRFDPLTEMSSGPSLSGSKLVASAESAVLLLDPESGTLKKRIEVGDEISAPLTVGPQGRVWALVGSDQVVLVDADAGELGLRVKDLGGAEWPPIAAGDRLVVALRKRDKRRVLAYVSATSKNGVEHTYPNGAPPLAALPNSAGVVHAEERPPAIIARNLDGSVLWKTTERQRIVELRDLGDRILVGVGTRIRVLEPSKGGPLLELDFGEPVRRSAHGRSGGAVIVESGAVYGFALLDDPRGRAGLRDARLEFGLCALENKDASAAQAAAKSILERAPDDLDALTLLARAEERARSKEAPERWLAVARAAPPGDPVAPEAARALKALAGIEGRLVFERPVRDATVEGGAMILGFDSSSEARGLEPPFESRGRRPGKPEAKLGPYRVQEGKSPALVRENGANAAWTQTLEWPGLQIAATSSDHVVLIGSTAEGQAAVYRTLDGERVWARALGERLTGAAVAGERALFSTDARVFALPIAGGDSTFEVKLPEGGVLPPLAAGSSFIVASTGKLRILDAAKGKVSAQIALPSRAERLAVLGRTLVAALEDGALLAVDLDKGQVAGRLMLGRAVKLVDGGERLWVITEAGEVFVLAPDRRLRAS